MEKERGMKEFRCVECGTLVDNNQAQLSRICKRDVACEHCLENRRINEGIFLMKFGVKITPEDVVRKWGLSMEQARKALRSIENDLKSDDSPIIEAIKNTIMGMCEPW